MLDPKWQRHVLRGSKREIQMLALGRNVEQRYRGRECVVTGVKRHGNEDFCPKVGRMLRLRKTSSLQVYESCFLFLTFSWCSCFSVD